MNYILKLLLGAAGPLLQSILQAFVDKQTFNKTLDLAMLWVGRMNGQKDLESDAKRAAALQGILQDLKAVGITVGTSVAALALEMAVNKLKADA